MSRYLENILLIGAFVFCVLGGFLFLDLYPPYLDFDFASEAIFVNNYNFKESFDYYFSSAEDPAVQYSALFAASKLPFTLLLAFLQRLFQIAPVEMDVFFKVLAAAVVDPWA